MQIIFLDTETTGREESDRLVQLAYKSKASGEVVNEFFLPPIPISYSAMAIHHITNEMVADKSPFVQSGHQKKISELLENAILVAHNAPFDITILKKEGVITNKYIDTLRVARHILTSEQYSLQYLRYSLHLEIEADAHDALGDILVLEALFNYLQTEIKEKFHFTSEEEVVEKMIYLTTLPVLLESFKFGKYKGKSFKEVSQIDNGYIQWLYNSESAKPKFEQKEDLLYTLKNYL